MAIAIRGALVTAALLAGCSRHLAPARFAPPATYAAGSGPVSLGVADLDGDGRTDVVAGSHWPSAPQLAVMPNGGAGLFGEVKIYEPHDVNALALGDLNGDGVIDVATGEGRPGVNHPGEVHVLLGRGDGTLGDDSTVDTGPVSNGIAIADLDGDRKPDLVVLDSENETHVGGGCISVLLADGNGSYASPVRYPFPPASVAVGDVDGDGFPDLAVGAYGGMMTIFLNDRAGGFHPSGAYPAGPNTTNTAAEVTLADLNGDGKPDLAAVNFRGGDAVVLLNDGRGGFTLASDTPLDEAPDPASPVAVAAGDLNGDGVPDLAIADVDGVKVLLGYGDGTFAVTAAMPVGTPGVTINSSAQALALADVDGDTRLDIVALHSGGLTILLNGAR